MKWTPIAMETRHQRGHDVGHHFIPATKMVETGSSARHAFTDHIEDVLGMVEISAGTRQPYEEIVRLNWRHRAPSGANL